MLLSGGTIDWLYTAAVLTRPLSRTWSASPIRQDFGRDSNESSSDLSSAQLLPDAPRVEVEGAVDPVQDDSLFRIPIGANTSSVEVQILPMGASAALSPGVTIYDQTGRPIIEASFQANGNAMTIGLQTAHIVQNDGREQAIFLKIALAPLVTSVPGSSEGYPFGPNAPGTTPAFPNPPSPTPGFVLLVTKQFAAFAPKPPGATPEPITSAPSSGAAPVTGSTPLPTPIPGEPPAEESEVARPTPPPVVASPPTVRSATGPLPSLSAAALGGVLGAAFDPTPVVSIDDTLVVNLALDGPPPRADAPGVSVRSIVEPSDEDAGNHPSGALAHVRGSGGFPLFGTNLIAQVDTAETGEGIQDARDFPLFASAVTALPSEDSSTLDPALDPEPMTRGKRATSILAGFSIALAFASNLVLPELMQWTVSFRRACKK